MTPRDAEESAPSAGPSVSQDSYTARRAGELGDFVRRTREALGLSQEEASRRAGISKSTWQKIEWGEGDRARSRTLNRIAEALRLDAEVVVGLRDGFVSLPDATVATRTRQGLITSINDLIEWLTDDDLAAVEESVKVRAELRRMKRAAAGREWTPPGGVRIVGDDPQLPADLRLVRLAILSTTMPSKRSEISLRMRDIAVHNPLATRSARTALSGVTQLDARMREHAISMLDAATGEHSDQAPVGGRSRAQQDT